MRFGIDHRQWYPVLVVDVNQADNQLDFTCDEYLWVAAAFDQFYKVQDFLVEKEIEQTLAEWKGRE